MATGPIIRHDNAIAMGLFQIRVGRSLPNIGVDTPVLSRADSVGALANTKLMNSKEFKEILSGFPQQVASTIPIKEQLLAEAAFREFTSMNLALAQGLDPLAAVDATAKVLQKHTAAGTFSTQDSKQIAASNDGGVENDRYTVLFTSATTYDVIGDLSGHVGSGSKDAEFAPANDDGNARFTIPANALTGTWAEDDSFVFRTTAYQSGDGAFDNPFEGEIGFGAVRQPEKLRIEAVFTFPDGLHGFYVIMPRAHMTSSMELNFAEADEGNIPISIESTSASADVSGGHAVWDDKPIGVLRFFNGSDV